jgi:UDP-N-acetyl-D-glucosamine dehydrogenase
MSTRGKVAIIGQGYVGQPLALEVVRAGYEVIGVDVDSSTLTALAFGQPGTGALSPPDSLKLTSSQDYLITDEIAAVANASIVILAVPTPLDEERHPDTSILEAAATSLVPHLLPGTLVINESTSYPGTLRNLLAPILQSRDPSILLATAPERVDPASREFTLANTLRLVAGLTSEATAQAKDFYATIVQQVEVVASPEIAEAAKLFENTFRQVNIALVNELAQICHLLGIPVWDVIEAASTKPFGFMSFHPSAGVGGHCIPVDPSYLSWSAEQAGGAAKFINLANEVNLSMPTFVVKRVIEIFGGSITGKKIRILGVAYKPDVADTRETPARSIIAQLRDEGAEVSWHDPHVETWMNETSAPLVGNYDLALLVTDHYVMHVPSVIGSGALLFDTTGKYRNLEGVIAL